MSEPVLCPTGGNHEQLTQKKISKLFIKLGVQLKRMFGRYRYTEDILSMETLVTCRDWSERTPKGKVFYLVLWLVGSWCWQGLTAGQVGVVIGGVAQNQHRLLPLQLGQLVDDVEQLLQMVLKDLQGRLLPPRPHFLVGGVVGCSESIILNNIKIGPNAAYKRYEYILYIKQKN